MKTGLGVKTKLQYIVYHLPTVWSREILLLCSIDSLTELQLKDFCEIEVVTCIKAHQRLSVNNKWDLQSSVVFIHFPSLN